MDENFSCNISIDVTNSIYMYFFWLSSKMISIANEINSITLETNVHNSIVKFYDVTLLIIIIKNHIA